MAASIAAGQTMELREEPRQLVTSTESIFPTKGMAFASDYDDEPPAYVTDFSVRGRDQPPRPRPRDGNGRSHGLPHVVSIYTPPPSRGRDFNSNPRTTEPPLRPNRRDDLESGGDGHWPTSQVMLPASANNKPKPRRGSSGANSAKSWFKNIRSPIGESPTNLFMSGPCANSCFPQI